MGTFLDWVPLSVLHLVRVIADFVQRSLGEQLQ